MRHQKKRWFAALLSLCMLLSILPSTSLAFSESEETWSGNRRNQTIDGGTHTITLSNLTIDSPGVEKSAIDITGNADVTFILEGNNTLRGYRNHPAIWVESGSSVTFEGNGLTSVEPLARHKKVAICARVHGVSGENFPPPVPPVMPCSTAHSTAS